MKKEKIYGYFGWKEFIRNRKNILDEFDKVKGQISSRPVQTEHGNSGEAAIRKWLTEFLPDKFGVTSGYIIPDIVLENYLLHHYDIIIYDKINSPILWGQTDYDTTEQGKKRAIPAKYVYSIIEVKSSFNDKTIKDSLKKLSEINSIYSHFPENFISLSVFIDLDKEIKNTRILMNFLETPFPFKYYGGIIIRCDINKEMTGLYHFLKNNDNKQDEVEFKVPLVKDIDNLNIKRNNKGSVSIGEQYCGVTAFSDGKQWHLSKIYGPILFKGDYGITLEWSYNHFTKFAINLLAILEGRDPKKQPGFVFGQVFDIIE